MKAIEKKHRTIKGVKYTDYTFDAKTYNVPGVLQFYNRSGRPAVVVEDRPHAFVVRVASRAKVGI